MALVELSVVEQRYHAVIEVLGGAKVTDVAARYGVSRQSVHTWVRRYRDGGLAALADRSHRVRAHPMQTAAAIEAMICELRRAHPSWGPRTLGWELARRGVEPVPSRASIYRALVRNSLISPQARRRKREDYVRWERPGPMQLWQMDIMGGLLLADGSEAKLITGVDDHSRFCVIASVVLRPTGRLVRAAFATAMRRFGVPLEVLTDNSKQFTARFGGPKAGEVLFERVCRENGITLRHTAPRTPTTTGKIERFHQTVRRELLAGALPFLDLDAAQAAVEAFVEHYNTARPHQALDMAFPADRFHARRDNAHQQAEQEMPLHLPAGLAPVADPAQLAISPPVPAASTMAHPEAAPAPEPVIMPVLDPLSQQAIEVDRVVPDSGNLSIGGQQVWLGPDRAGLPITLWISTSRLHVFTASGGRLKSVASRLSVKTLAALIASGQARPARCDPAHEECLGGVGQERAFPLAGGQVVEIDQAGMLDRGSGIAESQGDVHPVAQDVGRSERRPLVVAVVAEPLGCLGCLVEEFGDGGPVAGVRGGDGSAQQQRSVDRQFIARGLLEVGVHAGCGGAGRTDSDSVMCPVHESARDDPGA